MFMSLLRSNAHGLFVILGVQRHWGGGRDGSEAGPDGPDGGGGGSCAAGGAKRHEAS